MAGLMLATAALISLADSVYRILDRVEGLSSERQRLLLSGIPVQLIANITFQFLVPLACGLAVGLLAEGLRWLALALRNRPSSTF